MDSSADPLTCLRRAIASNKAPTVTTSEDASDLSNSTDNLAIATHLHFSDPDPQTFALDVPTRFISADKPVDLRSIYFAWQKKDVAIPDYIASAQELNEELAGKARVQNLVFVERLDLITWLEGASEESEYIKVSEADAAARSAQVASGAAGGVSTVPSGGAGGRPGKAIDPRLQEIYNGERRMGDRNSVLRGIKPTVRQLSFSVDRYVSLCSSLHRISLTSASPLRSSFLARVLPRPVLVLHLQQHLLIPHTPHLSPLTPKDPRAVPTPLSSSPLPPPPSFACPISNPSSNPEPTYPRTLPLPAHLAPQPTSCTSHAFSQPSMPTGPYVSFSSTPRNSSSPTTGTVWLLYLPPDRPGSSRATNGSRRRICLNTLWGFM